MSLDKERFHGFLLGARAMQWLIQQHISDSIDELTTSDARLQLIELTKSIMELTPDDACLFVEDKLKALLERVAS